MEWAPVAGQAEAVPAVPRNAPSAIATTICKRISVAAIYRLQRAVNQFRGCRWRSASS